MRVSDIFQTFLHHFVLAKLATSRIRIIKECSGWKHNIKIVRIPQRNLQVWKGMGLTPTWHLFDLKAEFLGPGAIAGQGGGPETEHVLPVRQTLEVVAAQRAVRPTSDTQRNTLHLKYKRKQKQIRYFNDFQISKGTLKKVWFWNWIIITFLYYWG